MRGSVRTPKALRAKPPRCRFRFCAGFRVRTRRCVAPDVTEAVASAGWYLVSKMQANKLIGAKPRRGPTNC